MYAVVVTLSLLKKGYPLEELMQKAEFVKKKTSSRPFSILFKNRNILS